MDSNKPSIKDLFQGNSRNFSFNKEGENQTKEKIQPEPSGDQPNERKVHPIKNPPKMTRKEPSIMNRDKKLKRRINIRNYMKKRGMGKRMLLEVGSNSKHDPDLKMKIKAESVREERKVDNEQRPRTENEVTSQRAERGGEKEKIVEEGQIKERNEIKPNPLAISKERPKPRPNRMVQSERPPEIHLNTIIEEHSQKSDISHLINSKRMKDALNRALKGKLTDKIFEDVQELNQYFKTDMDISEELRSYKRQKVTMKKSALAKIVKHKGVDRMSSLIKCSIFMESAYLEKQDLWNNKTMQNMMTCILKGINEISRVFLAEAQERGQRVVVRSNLKNMENREVLRMKKELVHIFQGILGRSKHLEKKHGLDTNRFEDNSFSLIFADKKLGTNKLEWKNDYEQIVKMKQSLALKEYKGRYKTLIRSLDDIVKLNVKGINSLEKIAAKNRKMQEKLRARVFGPYLDLFRGRGEEEALDLFELGVKLKKLEESSNLSHPC